VAIPRGNSVYQRPRRLDAKEATVSIQRSGHRVHTLGIRREHARGARPR
jgi:hypothetical protein